MKKCQFLLGCRLGAVAFGALAARAAGLLGTLVHAAGTLAALGTLSVFEGGRRRRKEYESFAIRAAVALYETRNSLFAALHAAMMHTVVAMARPFEFSALALDLFVAALARRTFLALALRCGLWNGCLGWRGFFFGVCNSGESKRRNHHEFLHLFSPCVLRTALLAA